MQALLNRLSIAVKYAIVGVLVIIVTLIPTSMVVMEKVQTARQASAAATHLAPATQVLEIIRLSQQARGLSNAYLNGNDSAATPLADALRTLQQAHEQAEASMKDAGVSAQITDQLGRLRSQIQELGSRAQSKGIPATDSFSQYTQIVTQQLAVLTQIVSATGLDLDAYPDSYALINGLFTSLPPLTEYLGQARGFSSGLLARGAASPADRQRVAALQALSTDRLQAWDTALATALRSNPRVEQELSAAIRRANDSTRDALALTQREILEAQTFSHASSDYFAAMTVPIDAQFELAAQSSTLLGALLDERSRHAQTQLWILLAGLTAIALVVIWLAVLLTRSAIVSMKDALNMARTVARGDLTSVARINGKDEVQQLLQALNEMNGNLVRIVAQVRNSTNSIATAASQIAAGNLDLSERTVAQAASLEETAASMEQLTSTVTQNSENAAAANSLTRDATAIAHKGGEAVQQFIDTMSTIRDTSSNIADIVGIIDGIAFQTNILALNAAVEAARAGEAGKGFAVVASEVRSLAQRSATSAGEIRTLINQSASEIDAGSQLANAAGETMRELLKAVEQVGHLMSEIAVASTEQSSGIAQVNIAVGQMDGVTQQNAALVEEASRAAESMREQAAVLVEAVGIFHLPESDDHEHPAPGMHKRRPALLA